LRVSLRAALALAVLGAGARPLAGNVETNDAGAWPAQRALGREVPAHRGEEVPEASVPAQPPREPAGVLTLRQALELALMHSPELAAAAHGVRAAEADVQQAGSLPNPELEIEAEGFGGSGEREAYDTAETTVRVSQDLELGGKRGKRQRLAQAEARLTGWEYEAQRLDAIAQTKKAFVEVLLAQGQLGVAESQVGVAESVGLAAAQRVRAGKVPPLEATKAAVEAASARIARDHAQRELGAARKRLAAAWGGTSPVFNEAAGDLTRMAELPAFEQLAVAEAPEVARGQDEAAVAMAALALARAARIPDVSLSAGISRFEEDGTQAGTAALSLPLPVFDRNAGGLAAARHRATRAEYDRRAARLRAVTDLVEAHGRGEAARAEAVTIQTELLPGARQAFDAAQAGYREGKLGQMDVLDTQRTFGEAQARYLTVLADYHKAVADVERLTGTPLSTLK
jgi:cobalt-zinc-cadmium efflux system outer membrane protein